MTDTFPVERQAQCAVLGVASTFTSLAIISCVLRAIARRLAHRSLDSSDWCIFAACLVTTVYQAINMTSVFVCGVGLHFSEILEKHGTEPITLFLKASKSPLLPLPPSFIHLSKISILILYTKIFSVPAFIWAARITTVIIIMWALTTSIMGLTICQPFAFNWDPTIPDGLCGNQVLSYKITGALNLATDLVVLLLPMPYLYGLNLALYKKLVLMVTFAVGLFTCVVSAFRIAALSSIDYSDITFNVPTSLIFSGLEPSLVVTLACVPVLRLLLGKIKGSISGSDLRSGQANSSGFVGSKNRSFAPLNDDSSQYQLRPVGPKHVAEAKAKAKTPSTWSGDNSDRETGPANKTGSIVVQQEWDVAEEGR
ncbi:hypothetical protein MYCTH_2113078 [Thermothelomyces thermophilus ATCC 42464]|uniref:Rhodopsin domain-containing protein n=1 Tax=Thermothelomyces thermophilus (strain ATCC 42464 / BCRC 31852 / DSM 1799) TaxID=573729 RepID=G2QMC9_THET4|nr:uncharacterized protein MYCTH_2113078 [Thermothelomyces thermophilus ATCC 42464]AEO61109.1 hypothetical protein MYCTH_2113078 [Thermothelomyces thermophilus ATCC 42464]